MEHGLFDKFKNMLNSYDPSGIIISLALLFFCFFIELLVLGYKKSSVYQILHPNKSVVTDVVIGLAYTLGIFFFLKTFYLLSLDQFFPDLVKSQKAKQNPNMTWWYIPVLLLYLVIADFLKYVFHRLSHELDFLWQIHKFHHSTTSFIILSGNRIHPIEHILHKVFVTLPLVLLGIQIDMYFALVILMLFIDKLQHSMLDWDYGKLGKYLIYSPIGHRIHHSEIPEHWDKNYGDLFVFWDRLFGTYYKGNLINEKVGVSDNWMNKQGLVYDLWHCAWLSANSLKRSIKTNIWRGEHLQKKQ
ncbi:MAG: alkylglycerol monooxygenase [Chitinophagales bacterium]|jgi:alkylglycerol monooxygenase